MLRPGVPRAARRNFLYVFKVDGAGFAGPCPPASCLRHGGAADIEQQISSSVRSPIIGNPWDRRGWWRLADGVKADERGFLI
jgi:hypothetical protein